MFHNTGMNYEVQQLREGSVNGLENDAPMEGFRHISAIPIRVSREQSSGMHVESQHNNNTTMSVDPKTYSLANLNIFQNIPKETARGVDDLSRMRMSLLSGIPEEIKWALKKYLAYSNKAPYMINLQKSKELLPLFNRFIEQLVDLINKFNEP